MDLLFAAFRSISNLDGCKKKRISGEGMKNLCQLIIKSIIEETILSITSLWLTHTNPIKLISCRQFAKMQAN